MQGGKANSAEARIRSNLQSTLSRKFMDAMSEYNDCQQKYKGKYQDKVERQYKIVNPNATEEQLEAVRRVQSAQHPVHSVTCVRLYSRHH